MIWEYLVGLKPEDWSLFAAIASVVGTLFTIATAIIAWLYFAGRWIFKDRNASKKEAEDQTDQPERPPAFHFRHGLTRQTRTVQGREADLEKLRAGLAARSREAIVNADAQGAAPDDGQKDGAVVRGGGGVGKTTLARYFIDRHGQDYNGIFWGLAETEGTLAEALKGLAPVLNLGVSDLTPLAAAQAVLTALENTPGRKLFVYDNVNSYTDIKNLMPPGELIVTTRYAKGWDAKFAVLPADTLDHDGPDSPAVKVLTEAAGTTVDLDGAERLAAALGGLPLALVVAGGLIRDLGGSFSDYLTQLDKIIGTERDYANYEDSVKGAVQLSYEALKTDDAKLVADLFAWWAPEGLEPQLISAAPQGQWWDHEHVTPDISDPVRALAGADGRVRAAMAELQDRSLLSQGDDGAEMHRMTAAALRAMQDQRGAVEIAKAAAALLMAVYPGGNEPNHSANWPLCRRLTPHVRALWDSGAAPETAVMDTLLNQSAIFLNKIADYPGMLEMARAALNLRQARLPEAHRGIAVGHATLGAALESAGDLPGALAALDRAIELDDTHRPGTATAAENYDLQGGVLLQMGRARETAVLPRAAKRYQQALALRRRLFGRQSYPVAQSLNNLGTVRDAQGRTAAAARLFGASLAINRTVLPAGDARLGYGLVGTGAMWLKAGRADRAEPLLDEALDLRRLVYAEQPQHPETKNTASWLVTCLLIRARAGENTGAREARAKQLCKEFGFDFEQRQQEALQYPYTPDTPTP